MAKVKKDEIYYANEIEVFSVVVEYKYSSNECFSNERENILIILHKDDSCMTKKSLAILRAAKSAMNDIKDKYNRKNKHENWSYSDMRIKSISPGSYDWMVAVNADVVKVQ